MTDRRDGGRLEETPQALRPGSIFPARRTGSRLILKFAVWSSAGALLLFLGVVLAPAPARAFDIKAGQSVYENHCQSCHGPEGTPTMPGTPDFARGEGLGVTDSELARGIKRGKNLMPAYEALMKDEDVLNVIAYIRTFQR